MKEVTIETKELIKILVGNREQHIVDYQDMMKVFKVKIVEEAEQALQEVKDGNYSRWSLQTSQPTSNVSDYDYTIRMLELSVDDTTTLSEQDFKSCKTPKGAEGKMFSSRRSTNGR